MSEYGESGEVIDPELKALYEKIKPVVEPPRTKEQQDELDKLTKLRAAIPDEPNNSKLYAEAKKLRDSLDVEYHGRPLAEEYLKFVVDELKPFVDQNFRTLTDKKNTCMMGSSMGGLITIYAKARYPEVFGAVACLSTHFLISFKNNPEIPSLVINYLKSSLPNGKNDRIYFDFGTGTLDAWYEPYQKEMDLVMKSIGFVQGKNWETRKFEGAEHSEVAWRKRLDVPLVFLLGK